MAKRSNRFVLLLSSFGIAAGLVLIGIGLLSAETGRAALDLPSAIQSTDPIRGSVRVPSQTPVFVDLAEGHTGVFIIDGRELETIDLGETRNPQQRPDDGAQVDVPPGVVYEAGNATLTYTPNDEGPIEEFSEGLHTVQVVYWKITEGRESARSYTFTFNVF
jgi:hypothetical protein